MQAAAVGGGGGRVLRLTRYPCALYFMEDAANTGVPTRTPFGTHQVYGQGTNGGYNVEILGPDEPLNPQIQLKSIMRGITLMYKVLGILMCGALCKRPACPSSRTDFILDGVVYDT